jgi:glycosyltransferase involved in cell wall biosynthesis
MTRRIVFDGFNLALERGTGIATYTRMLARVARDLGHQVGVVYSSMLAPAKNPKLREIAFFDVKSAVKISKVRDAWNYVSDQARYHLPVRPTRVELSGLVVARQFEGRLPVHDQVFVARNLFMNARDYFSRTKQFVDLNFDERPDIFHCTFQMPLRAKSACNIYTIHDLVPLRLPFTSLDNKRQTFRLLKMIAAKADHIVTVSENSRRDIIELLGVEEARVTNTYQAVEFPKEHLDLPDDIIAEQLEGSFGLEFGNYLLFYAALEPKKNMRRLIEAYLMSGVDIPLVIVASGGWENEAETKLIAMQSEKEQSDRPGTRGFKRRIHRFDYMSIPMLMTLIRGARAVLFPSLYEGFGLPVLESMVLGTPVVTSRESCLPEIAGDAALLVNPYETDDIARAIKRVTADADLRTELSRRGRVQAELFSVERYRERVQALYGAL